MKPSVAVLALCLSALRPLVAQELKVGARVRFKPPETAFSRVEGTVLSLDEKSFTVRLAGRDDTAAFERSSVDKLEVRTREGKRFVGGFIGLLTGVAIGTTLALTHSESDCEGNSIPCTVAVYAVPLGLLGMTIGAAASPGARWEKVRAGGLSVLIAPRPGRGIEARLTVRF